MFQNQANSSSFIFYRVALLFNGFWKTQSWFLNHWYYISFEFETHPSLFIFWMLWQKKRIDPQCVDHIKISLTRNVRHFWINFKFWWKSLIQIRNVKIQCWKNAQKRCTKIVASFFFIFEFSLVKSNQCNAGLEQIEMKVYNWGEKQHIELLPFRIPRDSHWKENSVVRIVCALWVGFLLLNKGDFWSKYWIPILPTKQQIAVYTSLDDGG